MARNEEAKKEVKKHYPLIKEMYEKGIESKEIAEFLGVSKGSIYNAISSMGISARKKVIEENEKKLARADDSCPVFERMIINGKCYTDITPIFAPR